MTMKMIKEKGGVLFIMLVLAASMVAAAPSYADTINEEELISDINTPENGVIQYDVTVPAGSTVNYMVELTPDKGSGTIDKVEGMWKNTTKKTVTKTITAKVKFLSSEYMISATYTSNSTQQKLEYKDQDTAVKSYKDSLVHSRFTWDTGSLEDLKSTVDSHIRKITDLIK